MKLQENNIDVYIKLQIENSSVSFDKKQAWKKLEKRRNKKMMKQVTVSFSVLIIAAFILFLNTNHPKEVRIANEYQKRQKLEKYERELSGTYEELLYCYDCNGEIIQSQIKQVPENATILKIY